MAWQKKKKKSPLLAAVSVWIVITALAMVGGVLITRSTGSYYGGLIASNLGSLLGIILGIRLYNLEKNR